MLDETQERERPFGLEDYRRKRADALKGMLPALFQLVVVVGLLALLLWLLFPTLEKIGFPPVLIVAFIIVALLALVVMGYRLKDAVADGVREIRWYKNLYLSSLTGKERQAPKVHDWQFPLVAVVLPVLVIGSLVRAYIVHEQNVENLYLQAQQLVDTDQYDQAEPLLWELQKRDYRDSWSLLQLCRAKMKYPGGDDSESAYYLMLNVEFYYQTPESQAKIDKYVASLEAAHELYWKIQLAQEKEKESEPLLLPYGGNGGSYHKDPGVDEFSDPEDFYDWYADDFYDYEDAEDYYYGHGGD